MNKVYHFRVLPFGLSIAPQLFNRLIHTVAGNLNRLQILVLPYLDNWLLRHPDRQVVLCHQSQLLKMLWLVGFKLNVDKLEMEPVEDSSSKLFCHFIKYPRSWDHSISPQFPPHWVVCT